jgi:AcrR family transcriptional regulator
MSSKRQMEPRRQPAQARGRERVAKILDAADAVFFELGYEGATTDAIAAKAGASIGSVYQFFPNKAALFRAVALRYLEQIRGVYAKLATDDGFLQPVEELIERVLTEFAAFHRKHPALRQLLLTSLALPELLAATEEMHRDFEQGVQLALRLRAPKLSQERLAVMAAVCVGVFSSLIWTATRADSGFERHVINEGKRLFAAYLEPSFERPARAKRKKR